MECEQLPLVKLLEHMLAVETAQREALAARVLFLEVELAQMREAFRDRRAEAGPGPGGAGGAGGTGGLVDVGLACDCPACDPLETNPGAGRPRPGVPGAGPQ